VGDPLFDKAAADALLPRLRQLIERLQELSASEAMSAARQRIGEIGRSNGHADHSDSVIQQVEQLQSVLDEIESTGVILRDPETGLCDFPAVRDGAEVFLCWRLDEDELAWWHPRDTGVAGRQPL
jgi:hypothetical protein